MDRDFTNPVTETTYRLRVAGGRWRITKVYREAGQPVLRHLGGPVGDGTPPDAVVDALVRGERRQGDLIADPDLAFAEVALSDLCRSYVILAAIAREARSVCKLGRPGFRPNCGHLRRQRDEALARLTGACLSMAGAWSASGLAAAETPDWLAAALADLAAPPARA